MAKAQQGSKKRMTRSELRQPDEVMSKLEQVFEQMAQYRVLILGGIGALLVVAIGLSVMQSVSASGARKVSSEFAKVLRTANAPIVAKGEEPLVPLPAGTRSFETEEARAKAALEKLQAFSKEHGGGEIGKTASVLEAATRFDLGEHQAAVDALTAYLQASPDSPLAPVIHHQLGIAHSQLGRASEATAHYQKLAEQGDWWFQAQGHMSLGDLVSPLVRADGAQKDKALASYKAALEALPKEGGQVAAQRFLKEELEKRVALLQ